MKIRIFTYVILLLIALSAKSQYISEVLEYVPAPGQLINASPWGNPSSAKSIIGGTEGNLSLGAFGGYVVFKFDQAVENNPENPFGIDFTIFGNALSQLSESGIVMVMKDENNNGLADDTWYELAGSDYYFSSTIKDYEVTYYNPGDTTAKDVAWVDNLGNEGWIFANPFHNQPYYPLMDSFPLINSEQYILAGTRIRSTVDTSEMGFVISKSRAFGYADNYKVVDLMDDLPDNPYTPEIENSGGDAFDIGWAVDIEGDPVELDAIDFIKVHTGVNANTGLLGEISTEIKGAVDVQPDPTVDGVMKCIVINDLPDTIKTRNFQLEVIAFEKGIPQEDEVIKWSGNMPEAYVDDDNMLSVDHSGELELTAALQSDPEISTTVAAYVNLESSGIEYNPLTESIYVCPNPVQNSFFVKNAANVDLQVVNVFGRVLYEVPDYHEGEYVDFSRFNAGVYFLRLIGEKRGVVLQFLKI